MPGGAIAVPGVQKAEAAHHLRDDVREPRRNWKLPSHPGSAEYRFRETRRMISARADRSVRRRGRVRMETARLAGLLPRPACGSGRTSGPGRPSIRLGRSDRCRRDARRTRRSSGNRTAASATSPAAAATVLPIRTASCSGRCRRRPVASACAERSRASPTEASPPAFVGWLAGAGS